MKFNNNRQMFFLYFLIIATGVVTGINRKAFVKLAADPVNKLLQVKKTKAGTIRMQVLPIMVQGGTGIRNQVYTIRITINSNQAVKQTAAMQYMNFGIKNGFCAVQGRDTLSCTVCERIPGIRGNEFSYLTCFNTSAVHAADDDLRICITDTVAGFGKTMFVINAQLLKEMKQ